MIKSIDQRVRKNCACDRRETWQQNNLDFFPEKLQNIKKQNAQKLAKYKSGTPNTTSWAGERIIQYRRLPKVVIILLKGENNCQESFL